MSYLPDKLFPLSVPDAPVEAWRRALLDAAEYIRVHGWCQQFYDGDKVCLVGALHAVLGSERVTRTISTGATIPAFEPSWPGVSDDAAEQVRAHLHLPIGESVADWNDEPGRTADEVISALESAARS